MVPQVLLDTCVLYPNYLRDVLLRLAETGLFRPLWSSDILIELQRNLVKRGIEPGAVDRMIALMNRHFDEAEVIGYEPLIEAMTCESKDRHVLAAAVCSHADLLLTFNGKDFPPSALKPYEVAVITPNDFLLDMLDLSPRLVIEILSQQAEVYKSEPKTLAGLLAVLYRSGVSGFVDEVRRLTA